MKFLSLVNIGQAGAGNNSLASGIQFASANGLTLGDWAVEGNSIYEFARVSGTCTYGDLLYQTGNALGYVVKTMTGARPAGVSMIAPTASGQYTYMLKYGIANVQITNTVGITSQAVTAGLFGGVGSAAMNYSAYVTNYLGGGTAGVYYIGQALSTSTGSQTLAKLSFL